MQNRTILSVYLFSSLLLCLLSATAYAMETSYFAAPSTEGFVQTSEEDGDGDGDGIKETHIVHYMNMSGDRLFSMTTNGKLWAWSLQLASAGDKGGESDNSEEPGTGYEGGFVVRDSNCDGVFDERYTLDEEFHVPECLK